jgi:DNA repair protein RadC
MKTNIETWSVADDLPRERLMSSGVESLTNKDLIALILGSGSKDVPVMEMANVILEHGFGKLTKLSQFSLQDWMAIKGIGFGKAAVLTAVFELARRRRFEELDKKKSISCSNHAFEYLVKHLGDLTHEEFWILLLNRNNSVITAKRISEGGLTATLVDPKKVFSLALQHHANSIILAHNHPSGSLIPSEHDLDITAKLRAVGKVMELLVMDHLIVHGNAYFSFADQGLLE